jgi:hypothetical protein
VIVDGDPLLDISLFEKSESIAMVIKGGTTYVDRLPAASPR